MALFLVFYLQVSPVIHSNATTCTTVMGVMRHNARQIDKLQVINVLIRNLIDELRCFSLKIVCEGDDVMWIRNQESKQLDA